MNKIGVILTGHGDFSIGLYDSLCKIAGVQSDFECVVFDVDCEESIFNEKLENAIIKLDECNEVLVLCDILGGTPFKNAVEFSVKYPHIRIVTGVNLPLLIELSIQRNISDNCSDILKSVVDTGKNSIQEFSLDLDNEDEDEEEL